MGYSMGSLDCIALKFDGYKEALFKDIKELKHKSIQNIVQQEIFKKLQKEYKNYDLEDFSITDLSDEIRTYDYDENYARVAKINLDTGKIGNFDYFDGDVYELNFGSNSIYEPDYKSKDEVLNAIKNIFYIPREFKLEDNVVFLTGVCGG